MGKKNKKKHHNMPKLSLLDRCIYWFIFLILCCLWALVAALPYVMFDSIALSDGAVAAGHQRATVLWVLVPWMTFFLMTFILWQMPYSERRPLFGIRGYQYGPPRTPKIYPVFRKGNPKVWISDRQKQNRKRLALGLMILLLVSFIPYPWAFYGRDSLYYDGSVRQYNIFNVEKVHYSSGEVASVEFRGITYTTGGRYSHTRHWSVQVILTAYSGKEYVFNANDFRDSQGEVESWLTEMIALKQRYDPSIISFSGKEKLNKVVLDQNLNEAEQKLLMELFEVS